MSSAEDSDSYCTGLSTVKLLKDRNERQSTVKKPRRPPSYESFRYAPLPRKPGAIRLLKLLPGSQENVDVICELVIQKEHPSEPYPYEALSWCWGANHKSHYIHIRKSGKVYAKFVSGNLNASLKALRHHVRVNIFGLTLSASTKKVSELYSVRGRRRIDN